MERPIRALLLAAGVGSRLRPLTEIIPKCLVAIGGEPILERWLRSLENIECEQVIVNTHYFANQVENYLARRKASNVSIQRRYEKELLGTAGTLMANRNYFKGCTGLMIHADNATDYNLKKLLAAHSKRPKGCILTMLTFNTKKPEQCGIVETNEHGIVVSFHEKVTSPPGNTANAAIYAFDDELFEFLDAQNVKPIDFSIDVIPNLTGKIFTTHTDADFIDIGTIEMLKKARKKWRKSYK